MLNMNNEHFKIFKQTKNKLCFTFVNIIGTVHTAIQKYFELLLYTLILILLMD